MTRRDRPDHRHLPAPVASFASVVAAPTTQSSGPARLHHRVVQLLTIAVITVLLAGSTAYAVADHRSDQLSATTSAQIAASSLGVLPTAVAPVMRASASAPWSATARAVLPSVVSIAVANGPGGTEGSGVVLDAAGRVVTNNHVIGDLGSGAHIAVSLNDGRIFGASVVGADPATDLAVLQMANPPTDLLPITFADSSRVTVGEPVIAVGNPFGLSDTVTDGIISALHRPVATGIIDGGQGISGDSSTAERVVTNAVQTSAAINPGNSGGALVDGSGHLVGVNSSIVSLAGAANTGKIGNTGNTGIGFAIPANQVVWICQQLITKGRAEHPWLGITSRDANVQTGSISRAAAQVTVVSDASPAARGGLKPGDSVLAVDDAPVDGSLALVAGIRDRRVGDTSVLTIVRDGKEQRVTVTLHRLPTEQK